MAIKFLDEAVKDGINGGGRVAGLYLGGKGMGKKLVSCLLFIRFQGSIEDRLKVVRGGRQSAGHGIGLGHNSSLASEGKKRLLEEVKRPDTMPYMYCAVFKEPAPWYHAQYAPYYKEP